MFSLHICTHIHAHAHTQMHTHTHTQKLSIYLLTMGLSQVSDLEASTFSSIHDS